MYSNPSSKNPRNLPKSDTHPPSFIERGGELVARPPFLQENTHLRCFVLEAKREKLQAMCDHVFNEPTGGALTFRPFSNIILLTFAQIDRIYSLYLNDAERGAMPEIDVAFWIPLLSKRENTLSKRGGTLSEREGQLHLSWYNPYIFVDNPFAMATGREMYGFSKTIAQFQIPEKHAAPDAYWVETQAMDRFQADAKSRLMRVVEVVRTSGRKRRLAQPGEAVQSIISLLIGEHETLATRLSLGRQHLQNLIQAQEVQMVFLRQLRDVQNPTVAAYQEVIEASSRVARIQQGGFLPGSYELRLPLNASFPIAETLGLDSESNPIKGAYWMDFDFFLDGGKTIWKTGSQ